MIPILSGNVASATASTSYDVANSCRFNSGDSAKMAKSSSGGTRTKWTFSTWFKRCRTGAVDYIFSSYSGSNYCYVQINGNDNLRFLDYSSGNNCNKLAKPRIAKQVWIISPEHKPKEIFNPFFKPLEILVVTTNKMSGPGKSVRLIEGIIKSKIIL